MDYTPLFVTGGVALVTLLVIAGVVSARRERERIRRIGEWAARHRWTVEKNPTVDWTNRLPGKNRRGVSLLVHGTVRGYGVGVAEYSYEERSTDFEGSTRFWAGVCPSSPSI